MKRLYICNIKVPEHHCKYVCLHGSEPHFIDECTKLEFCTITNKKVKCKPIGKKQYKQYLKFKEL